MQSVDPKDVELMARFRKMIEGEISPADIAEASVEASAESSSLPTDDMKNILERFYAGLNSTGEEITKNVAEDRTLRSAMFTDKTENGVKVGSWEIIVNESKRLKTFDVVNVHTKEPIAMDLALYESAVCITKLLNFHVGINSVQIRKVLESEEEYARNRHDAALFKRRFKQRLDSGDTFRAAIAEDRYKEYRDQALKIREDIVRHSRTL